MSNRIYTKVVAEKYNIPVYQPHKIRKEYEFVNELKPDLILTMAYGQIIPQGLIDIPKYGCLNLHGSLLPKYRGAAPIQRAIMNGGMSYLSADNKDWIEWIDFEVPVGDSDKPRDNCVDLLLVGVGFRQQRRRVSRHFLVQLCFHDIHIEIGMGVGHGKVPGQGANLNFRISCTHNRYGCSNHSSSLLSTAGLFPRFLP